MSEDSKNKNTKIALIVAGVVILLGVGGYFWWRHRNSGQQVIDDAYSDLLFATGTATIVASSYGALDELAAFLIENPNKALSIIGHTDSQGSDSYNMKLSQQRAEAVKEYLLQKGVPPAAIVEVLGMGETMPIADNSTAEGREQNRRVEFTFKS